jgi:uncharacterized membrane protein
MRQAESLSSVFEEVREGCRAFALGRVMAAQRTTPERLVAFSDAILAVIITIMVLDLRPPTQATLSALLPLWPAALSYAVSYLFIAIIWVNHHHLLRFTEHATPRMIWVNFAHLFMVSLVPFSTAWVADTRLAAVPVFVYAAVIWSSFKQGKEKWQLNDLMMRLSSAPAREGNRSRWF